MQCPQCHYIDTKVMDTRVSADHTSIRRRRKCPACNYKFSTIETYCKAELYVIKRNGQVEEFRLDKLVGSLRKAIKEDELSEKKIETAKNCILEQIQNFPSGKIPSEAIGQFVMQVLKDVDPIAYLRFASIYKNFLEAKDFEQEFKNLHSSIQ